MSPDRWTRLATLVPDALELPPEQRNAFLDDACRQPTGEIDAGLRAEAEALVQSALDATDVDALQSPLAGLAGELAGEEGLASVAPPETVGPWRVTGVLGEGGQAVVYRARRADGAFEREVALKLLRPGAPAPRLAARLAEERRVLARLEHPGIARLYDGGLTDGGQPFLAMELIDGAPITAAAVSLRLRQQVELLAQVAQAVAYAHARLVVHRDLKPSNVLVTEDGRPRLLDFGVAKLLGDETDPDLTVPGWMTPAYAAPEQVAGGEVTTATDVYALGVLGYEILAGQRPYETAGLSPAETERVVCHADPPPASAAASGPRARALRGDLDTILAKALAKEPARRYPTASALADDLQRWLAGLPVEARPATATYRAGRFVRRHRAGVTAAALALAAVVAVSGVAFARVTSERDRAEEEAAGAAAARDFAFGMIQAPRSEESGRDVRVADLLDRASAVLDSTLGDRPGVVVEARTELGNTYHLLGLFEEAAAEHRRALAVATRAFGPDHQETASVEISLAAAYRELARFDEARVLVEGGLATLRQRLGDRDPSVAFAYSELSLLLLIAGDDEAAIEAAKAALAIDEAGLREDSSNAAEVAVSMQNVAVGLANLDRNDEAIGYLRRAAALEREIGDSHTLAHGGTLRSLGQVYFSLRRYPEAERALRQALAVTREAGGDRHPKTGLSLGALGRTLAALGRPDEAERMLRDAVAVHRDAYGPDHPDEAYDIVNLAQAVRQQGRYAEAEALARKARRLFIAGYGADHWSVGRADTTLAGIEADRGRR